MAGRSMLAPPPPRAIINLVSAAYGRTVLTFAPPLRPGPDQQVARQHTIIRSRVWLIATEDSPLPTCRLATPALPPPDPLAHFLVEEQQGRVRWYDLPTIRSARVVAKMWQISFEPPDELTHEEMSEPQLTRLDMVIAPCACGAGAVGSAGPTLARHTTRWVRTSGDAPWLTRV